jgi:hypothetical protein
MSGVELEGCADAIIASIHDGGMSPDNEKSNIQSLAVLWRVFTTRLGNGTYGDLIAHINMHATFELHEQPNDQFKITWKIGMMTGSKMRNARNWLKEQMIFLRDIVLIIIASLGGVIAFSAFTGWEWERTQQNIKPLIDWIENIFLIALLIIVGLITHPLHLLAISVTVFLIWFMFRTRRR